LRNQYLQRPLGGAYIEFHSTYCLSHEDFSWLGETRDKLVELHTNDVYRYVDVDILYCLDGVTPSTEDYHFYRDLEGLSVIPLDNSPNGLNFFSKYHTDGANNPRSLSSFGNSNALNTGSYGANNGTDGENVGRGYRDNKDEGDGYLQDGGDGEEFEELLTSNYKTNTKNKTDKSDQIDYYSNDGLEKNGLLQDFDYELMFAGNAPLNTFLPVPLQTIDHIKYVLESSYQNHNNNNNNNNNNHNNNNRLDNDEDLTPEQLALRYLTSDEFVGDENTNNDNDKNKKDKKNNKNKKQEQPQSNVLSEQEVNTMIAQLNLPATFQVTQMEEIHKFKLELLNKYSNYNIDNITSHYEFRKFLKQLLLQQQNCGKLLGPNDNNNNNNNNGNGDDGSTHKIRLRPPQEFIDEQNEHLGAYYNHGMGGNDQNTNNNNNSNTNNRNNQNNTKTRPRLHPTQTKYYETILEQIEPDMYRTSGKLPLTTTVEGFHISHAFFNIFTFTLALSAGLLPLFSILWRNACCCFCCMGNNSSDGRSFRGCGCAPRQYAFYHKKMLKLKQTYILPANGDYLTK